MTSLLQKKVGEKESQGYSQDMLYIPVEKEFRLEELNYSLQSNLFDHDDNTSSEKNRKVKEDATTLGST